MDTLLRPEPGLVIWTIVTFAALVAVLGRVVWKPVLAALDAREDGLRRQNDAAEQARAAAETLRGDYEARLAQVEAKTRELIAQAEAEGRRLKDDLARTAREESEKMLDAARRKLGEEERRLVRDLRDQMADFSVRAAEKILRRGMDKGFQERLLQEAVSEFEKWAGEKK